MGSITIKSGKKPVITSAPAKAAPKTKAVPKSKAKTDAQNDIERAKELVDIICSHNPVILAAADAKKLQEKARKELLAIVSPLYDDTEEIIVNGDDGKVKFTPRKQTTYVFDLKALHKLVGDEVFYALATFPMAKVKDHLTPDQAAKVTEMFYGNRTMAIFPADK